MTAIRDTSGLSGVIFRARTSTGLSSIANVRVRDASGLNLVWTSAVAMTAAIPTNAYGASARPGASSVTSETIAVTVTGGKPPFTYQWSKTGVPNADWVIINPTSFETRIQRNSIPANSLLADNFICTVTDSRGTVSVSNACAVELENYGGLD